MTQGGPRPALPQGVPVILASATGMALTDAIIRQASAEMSLWLLWVLRSALVLPVLFAMARDRVRAKGAVWIALRCLALVGMSPLLYPALPFVDLSLLGAASFTPRRCSSSDCRPLSWATVSRRDTGWPS